MPGDKGPSGQGCRTVVPKLKTAEATTGNLQDATALTMQQQPRPIAAAAGRFEVAGAIVDPVQPFLARDMPFSIDRLLRPP